MRQIRTGFLLALSFPGVLLGWKLAVLFGGSPETAPADPPGSALYQEEKRDLASLRQSLEAFKPKGYYVVIDTGANRLYLRRGDEVLLDAVCSAGSGKRLKWKDREWNFETPRGEFRIVSKSKNPIWRKPDWAFLEEGEALPPREGDRYEAGVLGEYALGIGDGYFIHGTLYTRLLGQNVTHGCVRLGDRDLAYLASRAPLGTPVYIY